MRFNAFIVLASIASVVTGQIVSVSLGGSASGSAGSGSGSASGSGSGSVSSSLPSAVISTVGGTVASVLVAGSSIAVGSFALVGSTLSTLPTVVDVLGLGPSVPASPGTVEGIVLGVGSLVSAGATSLTLTLAAPTTTVFDVFTSTAPGVVGTLLASVPITTTLPTLPILPAVVPLVTSLPSAPIPTVVSLLSVLPTVLGSVLSPILTPVLGLVGGLLGGVVAPVASSSPGVIGTVVVPLLNKTNSITILVDGNILNILNITVKFNKP